MKALISLKAFGLSEMEAVRYYTAMIMAERGVVSAPNMAVGQPFNIGGVQPTIGADACTARPAATAPPDGSCAGRRAWRDPDERPEQDPGHAGAASAGRRVGYNFYDRPKQDARGRPAGAPAGVRRAGRRRAGLGGAGRGVPAAASSRRPPARRRTPRRTRWSSCAPWAACAPGWTTWPPQIVGMPVPAQDKTWWRFRDEHTLLARLLDFDYRLLLQTGTIGASRREL